MTPLSPQEYFDKTKDLIENIKDYYDRGILEYMVRGKFFEEPKSEILFFELLSEMESLGLKNKEYLKIREKIIKMYTKVIYKVREEKVNSREKYIENLCEGIDYDDKSDLIKILKMTGFQ